MLISIEKCLQQRDADAALYLISRILDVEPESKREELYSLQNEIQQKGCVEDHERKRIVALFREVIG